jgi:hypothetical protein
VIRWAIEHPEAAFALLTVATNVVVEVLEKLGAQRAASAIAAVTPHARGLIRALAGAKIPPAGGAGGAAAALLAFCASGSVGA